MKAVRNILMTVMVSGLLFNTVGLADTIDISPSADTFVNANGPDNNEGTANYIWVAGPKNVLMKFDLSAIPSGQVITSAKLKIYVYYVQSNTTTYVYKETDAWTETGATWNTTDGTTAWRGQAGGYGIGMTPNDASSRLDEVYMPEAHIQWYTWDVTPAAQDWYNNPSSNYGLLLERIPYGQGWKGYSREYGDPNYRPVLSVTYEPVPEPATIGLLLSGLGVFIRRVK